MHTRRAFGTAFAIDSLTAILHGIIFSPDCHPILKISSSGVCIPLRMGAEGGSVYDIGCTHGYAGG